MSGGCCGPFVPGSGGAGEAGADGGVAISAGTQMATSGTVSFANSNGITFGLSNSSILTASVQAIKTISGGTTFATGPAVSFANGSGVTFGIVGNTITASVAPETPFAISAGTQSVSTGTVSFANSNGVTFGMSGSNTITASVAAGAPEFSFSGYSPYLLADPQNLDVTNGSLHIQPLDISGHVVFTNLGLLMIFVHNILSTGSCTATINLGFYTRNVSTLSLMHSTSFSVSMAYSTNASNSLFNGMRLATCPWTSTITRGDYWAGFMASSSTSSQDATLSILHVPTIGSVLSGPMGAASATSNQWQLGQGIFSATTGALPSSVGFNEIRGTAIPARRPMIWTLGAGSV